MNDCYICQAEAVSRCFTCGQLICAKHGDENCHGCDTAVVAGDPRPFNVSAGPLGAKTIHRGWWRPQAAEAYEPPACYACKGLSRRVCRNCRSHYCREHAGPSDLCAVCGQSARIGFWVFIVAVVTMAALVLLGAVING